MKELSFYERCFIGITLVLSLFVLSPFPIPSLDRLSNTSTSAKGAHDDIYKMYSGSGRCMVVPTKHHEGGTYFVTAQHCIEKEGNQVGVKGKSGYINAEVVEIPSSAHDWAVIKGDKLIPTINVAKPEVVRNLTTGDRILYYHPELVAGGFIGRVAKANHQVPTQGAMIAVNIFARKGHSGSGMFHDNKLVGILSSKVRNKMMVLAVHIDKVPDKYLYDKK